MRQIEEGFVQADPPLLTGGSLHLALVGKGVDFLTLTVGEETGYDLITDTERQEKGHAGRGFGKSERRTCMGGHCWRRWQPFQEAKKWGDGYECWEWSGSGADLAATWAAGRDVRPSRVDVAFDFACEASLTADDVAQALEPHRQARGLLDGISGQGGVHTRYVGSKSSDRRVRIYRKDLQADVWAEMFGPTIRVELILRGQPAEAWWAAWAAGREVGYAAAAAHLEDMTGFYVQEDLGDIPQLVLPEQADEAQRLFRFMEQYGEQVAAWAEAGVPVVQLAQERAARSRNRMARSRYRRRLDGLRSIGVESLVSLVRALMAPTPSGG